MHNLDSSQFTPRTYYGTTVLILVGNLGYVAHMHRKIGKRISLDDATNANKCLEEIKLNKRRNVF